MELSYSQLKCFTTNKVPPIVSFGLGSVGYLCCFEVDNLQDVLNNCFVKKWKVSISSPRKIKKSFVKHQENPEVSLDDKHTNGDFSSFKNPQEVSTELDIDEESIRPYLQYRNRLRIEVIPHCSREYVNVISNIFPDGKKDLPSGSILRALNELTLESVSFDSMFTVTLYVDGVFLTNVTASGLIFATPTGSTAYNMSSGGSVVQTEVKAICITPLNPSSLSMRPILLPSKS